MVPFVFKPDYTKGERKYLLADNDSSNPCSYSNIREWSCPLTIYKYCNFTIGNTVELSCISDHDKFELLILTQIFCSLFSFNV